MADNDLDDWRVGPGGQRLHLTRAGRSACGKRVYQEIKEAQDFIRWVKESSSQPQLGRDPKNWRCKRCLAYSMKESA